MRRQLIALMLHFAMPLEVGIPDPMACYSHQHYHDNLKVATLDDFLPKQSIASTNGIGNPAFCSS